MGVLVSEVRPNAAAALVSGLGRSGAAHLMSEEREEHPAPDALFASPSPALRISSPPALHAKFFYSPGQIASLES